MEGIPACGKRIQMFPHSSFSKDTSQLLNKIKLGSKCTAFLYKKLRTRQQPQIRSFVS